MPGEVVSFNANVGPRSADNGFADGARDLQGRDARRASAAAPARSPARSTPRRSSAGIDIVERANHSRPSGYIRMGLDATVVYPTVDLKLENPYDFPVVDPRRPSTRARSPSSSTASERAGDGELRDGDGGHGRLQAQDRGGVAALAEGKVKLKQKGIRGILDREDARRSTSQDGRRARRGDDRHLPADVRDLPGGARAPTWTRSSRRCRRAPPPRTTRRPSRPSPRPRAERWTIPRGVE